MGIPRRDGIHREDHAGQRLGGTALPLRKPPQLLQGGGKPLSVQGEAGPDEGQPLPGEGEGHLVQNVLSPAGQGTAQLEPDLVVGAGKLNMKHRIAPSC